MRFYVTLLASLIFMVHSTIAQNVGIGTNNPLEKLHVAGGFRSDSLRIDGTESGDMLGQFNVYQSEVDQQQTRTDVLFSGPSLFWQSFTAGASGRLDSISFKWGGISQNNATFSLYSGEGPGGLVLFSKTITITGLDNMVSINGINVSAGQKYTFALSNLTVNSGMRGFTDNVYPEGICSLNNMWDLAFQTFVTGMHTGLVVKNSGRVGIGTRYPSSSLDVAGNLNVSGSITMGGALGIGTTKPQYTLDIRGSLRTNEFHLSSIGTTGYVLTSDVLGKGTWQALPPQPWAINSSNSSFIHFIPAGQNTVPYVGIGTMASHPLHIKTGLNAPLVMIENTLPSHETGIRLRSLWPSDGSSSTTITMGLTGSKFDIYADNNISLLTMRPYRSGDFSQGIRMGVNNFDPQAPLHVRGSATSTIASNIRFFNASSTLLGSTASWTGTVAGYFEGNVVSTISFIAAANNIFSDKRIKDIIGPSNGAEDLEKLRHIAITRYRYKDKWQMGNAVQTKVIAQQVQEVLPEAVSQIKNFIPDLLQEAAIVARSNNSVTIQLKEGKQLKAGTRLKCFDTGGNELLANVLSVKENTCTLDAAITGDKIFLYGTEVNDFNVVDYDAIAMLNVSATQELLRRLEKAEQTIAQLEALLKKLTKDQ